MWGEARRRRWVAEEARPVEGRTRSSRDGGGRKEGRFGVGAVEGGRLEGFEREGVRGGRGWSMP